MKKQFAIQGVYKVINNDKIEENSIYEEFGEMSINLVSFWVEEGDDSIYFSEDKHEKYNRLNVRILPDKIVEFNHEVYKLNRRSVDTKKNEYLVIQDDSNNENIKLFVDIRLTSTHSAEIIDINQQILNKYFY